MAEEKNIDWIAGGMTAVALWDELCQQLIMNGHLTPAEKDQVLERAISKLSGNPNLESAAQNIRTLFNRP